jgi:hypothetical protein
MATKSNTPAVIDQDRPELALLAAHVKSRLGEGRSSCRLDVRHLWANRFRVNVLSGGDVTSITIAQSYFIVADEKGNIVTSEPAIVASA